MGRAEANPFTCALHPRLYLDKVVLLLYRFYPRSPASFILPALLNHFCQYNVLLSLSSSKHSPSCTFFSPTAHFFSIELPQKVIYAICLLVASYFLSNPLYSGLLSLPLHKITLIKVTGDSHVVRCKGQQSSALHSSCPLAHGQPSSQLTPHHLPEMASSGL